MNAGIAAAPVPSRAVAVPGPDFGETLPSLVLGPLQRKSQPPAWGLSPGWRDGALTLLAVLACLLGVFCSVEMAQGELKIVLEKFSSVQFTCLIGSAKVRSVQFGARGPSASVQFVQVSSFSSVHELFRPCLSSQASGPLTVEDSSYRQRIPHTLRETL